MNKDVKRFSGRFMVFRMKPSGISKRLGGNRLPWFWHPTIESAEGEASRLSDQFPDSTFLIMQEVSRVKRAVEESMPADAAPVAARAA